VPAWKDVEQIMPISMREQYQPTNISPDACIFLEFHNDSKAYCRIHAIKSTICQEYPSFKANACINHPERRYTRAFFESQLARMRLQIQFIKDLYGDFVQKPQVFDLLTLMLDHGLFDHESLFQFFGKDWNLSKEEFDGLLTTLENLQLIKSIHSESKIEYESITTEEIKKMADLYVNAAENFAKSKK